MIKTYILTHANKNFSYINIAKYAIEITKLQWNTWTEYFIKQEKFPYEFDSIKKILKLQFLSQGLLVKLNAHFVSYSQQGHLDSNLMPCLILLSDVDCLKCSGTNSQIFAPKIDIESTP